MAVDFPTDFQPTFLRGGSPNESCSKQDRGADVMDDDVVGVFVLARRPFGGRCGCNHRRGKRQLSGGCGRRFDYEVADTEKGNELVLNHIGEKVKVTGEVEEEDDVKILTVAAFEVLQGE